MSFVPAELNSKPALTQYNGRINIMEKQTVPAFYMTQQPVNNCDYAGRATYGQQIRTPLSELFFSDVNIDALQKGIQNKIYNDSKGQYKVGRQSDDELKVVMRSIFFQYAKHRPDGIVDQVRELNGLVLDWCVPEILANIRQYNAYKKDASTLPMPMAWGSFESNKGIKNLEMRKFF